MSVTLERAVLELSTDSGVFFRDIEKAKVEAKSLGRNFDESKKSAASFSDGLGKLNGLLGAFGIAISGAAVIGFGRELLRMADDIQKFADRTSMSTEEVQRLQHVADQTGVSFDGLVNGVQNLTQRLGDGDKGAVGALKALGINAESFLHLNPYQQFTQISGAVGELEDPTRRAAVMADLFGKSWKEIGPAVLSDVQAIAAEAPVMSDATVKALDAAGDAWSKFTRTIKVWAAEAYTWAGRQFDLMIAQLYQRIGDVYALLSAAAQAASSLPGLGGMAGTANTLRESARWYQDASKSLQAQATAQQEVLFYTSAVGPFLVKNVTTTKGHGKAQQDVLRFTAETNREFERMAKEATLAKAAAFAQQFSGELAAVHAGIRGSVEALHDVIPLTKVWLSVPKEGLFAGMGTAGAGKGFLSQLFGDVKAQAGGWASGLADALSAGLTGATSLGSALKQYATTVAKDFAATALSYIPGIGPLLSQFAGPIVDGIKKLFGGLFGGILKTEGKRVNDLRDEFLLTFGPSGLGATSGFHTLAKQLHELGAAGDAAFQRLTKASKESDFRTAMNEVNALLDAHAAKQQAAAAAAEEAATKEQAAMEAVTSKIRDSIQAIDDEMKSLADAIANEAPEEAIGIVEQQQRDRMARLAEERLALEAQLAAEQEATGDRVEGVADTIVALGDEIDLNAGDWERWADRVRTAIEQSGAGGFTVPGPGGSEVPGHQAGAYVRRTHLAQVHAGELIGPVDFMARALRGALASADGFGLGALPALPSIGAGTVQHLTIKIGDVTAARATLRGLPRAATVVGL